MDLNTKIDFCIKQVNSGPVDDIEPTYTETISNIWAKRTQLLGQEAIKLGLEHNTVQVNFIVRARKDIAENMYIKHNNVIYNVVGFNELKDNPDYMLIATIKNQVTT